MPEDHKEKSASATYDDTFVKRIEKAYRSSQNAPALTSEEILADLGISGQAPEKTNDYIESIKTIAVAYRQKMETEAWAEKIPGTQNGGDLYTNHYTAFSGTCNYHARNLADIFRGHGFNAETEFGSYQPFDDLYWNQHGSAFYPDAEAFQNAEMFEFDDDHEWVLIDNTIIVDVTADQFHPADPDSYRVVVATKPNIHYR